MSQLYPRVLAEERDALYVRTSRDRDLVASLIRDAEKLLKKHPDEAREKAREAESILSRLRQDTGTMEEKEQAFDSARTTHRQELTQAESTIEETRSYLAGLLEAGYRADPAKELGDARAEMIRVADILVVGLKSEIPDYEAVISCAKRGCKHATAVREHWQKRVELQKENEEALKGLKKWRETVFPKLRLDYASSLERLKEETPEEVWRAVIERAEQAEQAFRANAETFLEDAERLNGMETQDFENAAHRLKELQRLKSDAEAAYQQPEKTLARYKESKQKTTALLGQAMSKIKDAERAVKDSDAEGTGKGDLNKAKSQVSETEKLMKSPLPNWIVLAAAVASVIALAESAERSAKMHANEVEDGRRRREAEERRRRENSYSSSGSSSVSSHSGGGFSGFGGGSFGGGGASGHW